MRAIPLNLAAFITAAVLVTVVSFALLQAGVFSDRDGGDAVTVPTQTPVVLDATLTPVPSEPAATEPPGRDSAY
jgi:hypothetical protein